MDKNILAISAALFAISAHAQNGINSPYSRYGFGIMSERSLGFNKGMGGVAQGFRNKEQINIANPASYSEVDSLTALFDLGITLQNGNYKMDNLQQNARNTSFDYFAFQFRAAKHLGMTVGIMPVTNINYKFTSNSETLNGNENITSAYNFYGDGGLREVFIGAGWQPLKRFSIGFNASYLWGEYSHTMTMAYSETTAFSLARKYSADISTYNAQAGIQYEQPISKDDKIVIGATYTLGHNVNNDAYRLTETLNSSSVETSTTDTIRNAFQLPHTIAAGLTYYRKNTLRVGADFELQKWSDCRFPNQQMSAAAAQEQSYISSKGQLNDRIKVSTGFDWTPKPEDKLNYFNRCTYKAGAYYSQSYANADLTGTITDKPYEFGISAGITLPIANRNIWRKEPRINISMQWVQTNIPYLNASTLRQSALKENYLRLCIGLSFNEHWFYKMKFQ